MAQAAVVALDAKRARAGDPPQSEPKSTWEPLRRLFVSWALATATLFGAGLAAKALASLMSDGQAFTWGFFWPLVLLSVGGGLAVASLRMAAWLVARGGALAIALLVVVVWSLVIWPTPFKYTVVDKQLYKINRLMGSIEVVSQAPPGRPGPN